MKNGRRLKILRIPVDTSSGQNLQQYLKPLIWKTFVSANLLRTFQISVVSMSFHVFQQPIYAKVGILPNPYSSASFPFFKRITHSARRFYFPFLKNSTMQDFRFFLSSSDRSFPLSSFLTTSGMRPAANSNIWRLKFSHSSSGSRSSAPSFSA